MGYQAVAGAALVTHLAFLGYVGLGGFLAWRRPHLIWPHLAATGWGVAVVALPLNCPLTHLQNWARRQAGEAELPGGFIDHYLAGVLYPRGSDTLVQGAVAAVVVGSWAGAAWRARSSAGRPRGAPPRARRRGRGLRASHQ